MKDPKVLLVEDDRVDAEAVKRAFEKQRISNTLIMANDGIEALEILRGEQSEPLQRPFIILLDLNMPRMNGLEFLKQLRADEMLRDTIVFVLTTSDDPRDKVAAYENQVAGYMVKSRVGEDFLKLTELLSQFWRIVEMPPAPH
ncbi:MAG: response regulator [Lacipirellulaceae bacterium]